MLFCFRWFGYYLVLDTGRPCGGDTTEVEEALEARTACMVFKILDFGLQKCTTRSIARVIMFG
jgi:hypothetical protein